MKACHDLLINGQWQVGLGESIVSREPASQNIIWEGLSANTNQVDQAIQAARNAFEPWRKLNITDRLTYLHRFEQAVKQHKSALIEAICHDTGRPYWEAQLEVQAVENKAELAFEAYLQRTGERVMATSGGHLQLRHRPHGALAVITSFSFPASIATGYIIPALLAGNCIVFKGSERTPKVSDLLAQLWQSTGLPDGVLNLLQGDKKVGQALVQHPDINGVLFTGTTSVGIEINQTLAMTPDKLVCLNMSANNPLIIGDVSNLKAALYHILHSSFISSGQRCSNARRLYLPDSALGDQMVEQLIEQCHLLMIGHYDEQPAPLMGPVINLASVKQILKQQQLLLSKGANVLLSAHQADEKSAFMSPGLLDISTLKEPFDEEIFGPILQIHRYQHFEQAIELANQSKYILTSGLISDNQAQFDEFDCTIQSGVVNWNQPITGVSGAAPYGGVGLSSNHRPGGWYSADYCAYPTTTMYQHGVSFPSSPIPGINLNDTP
ncbi:succinylglutamate-semialdehyde dehydrogenase [Litoribrevibacter albus]|uniref:N-succinylglutamate 5-semialdehyde dehydrogenase n=1 Tax=Litoribrevibacter albus TaxID=1473156 RepID=A0AA37SBB8_9GAMM|nr:succinylglutamate-semialdehyde dehydrogenase [Litoribrevibacter albus]GLQ32917.1 N-succinylglutamate 5-semialdehyde dehydrogenase [Litoribrevibacter albus]